jgi:hypothetical protein
MVALTDNVQRMAVLAAIRNAIVAEQAGMDTNVDEIAARIERDLGKLVEIVRRTNSRRIEPYLAQILDEICPDCSSQCVCGHCTLRHEGQCYLYRHADVLIQAIESALADRARDARENWEIGAMD